MSSVLLQVDSLSLVSNEGYITKDFSFELHRGEIIALTGKSGSGKTSVAMAILGLLPPGIRFNSGSIHWTTDDVQMSFPADSSDWPSLRGRHIGFTQQDVYGTFDPVLSMGKQMMMVVAERSQGNLPDIEKNIRLKMQETGLEDIDRLWKSYPHELSGGQLQRCQICMAISIQPELLITDEPTSAVDRINQTEILDVFSRLRDKYNMAILCITHETSVVNYLADREVRIGEMITASPAPPKSRPEGNKSIMSPILMADHLTYAYRYAGLRNRKGAEVGPVDFSLLPGTCLGIIGESGSGKSTLAQLLVGLLEPDSGKLVVAGKEIDFSKSQEISSLRSNVQLVMQDGRGSLHPYFTIGRLLNEVAGRPMSNLGEIASEVRKVITDVDLPQNILERKPGTLSGGECLRVCIARALLLHPGVLICDESTSGLDAVNRDSIIELLRHLMQTWSLAILFITHDEQLIRTLADYILVMAAGQVVEQGPANELLRFPAHPVTKKIFSNHATLAVRRHP